MFLINHFRNLISAISNNDTQNASLLLRVLPILYWVIAIIFLIILITTKYNSEFIWGFIIWIIICYIADEALIHIYKSAKQ